MVFQAEVNDVDVFSQKTVGQQLSDTQLPNSQQTVVKQPKDHQQTNGWILPMVLSNNLGKLPTDKRPTMSVTSVLSDMNPVLRDS